MVDATGIQRFILKYEDKAVDRVNIEKYLIGRRVKGNEKENERSDMLVSFW